MKCLCGCGKEIIFKPRHKWFPVKYLPGHNPKGLGMKGKHHTEKTKKHWSDIRKGKPSPMKGIHRIEKTKKKISVSKKGKPAHNKNKPMSDKQKQKISQSKKGTYTGINSPHWKGGSKLRIARTNNKRRSLGHSFINEPFENSEGHHIDNDNIVYIPKELHRSISHNVTTGKNMNLINLEALKWIMNQFKKFI